MQDDGGLCIAGSLEGSNDCGGRGDVNGGDGCLTLVLARRVQRVRGHTVSLGLSVLEKLVDLDCVSWRREQSVIEGSYVVADDDTGPVQC